jgi:hypothetical protein
MTKMTGQQIQAMAREILKSHPNGIQWTKLVQSISYKSPNTPINTIYGSVHKLVKDSKDIVKIAKGFYVLEKFQSMQNAEANSYPQAKHQKAGKNSLSQFGETAFYQPFAEWLRDELEEATEAMVLGGNIFKGKWGPPDVIGVLKPQSSDLVKFPQQIVSAEIKVDPNQTIVAFGQAVSYRLFSHKSYIVVPHTTQKADLNRLEALSIITGIGLVTFELDTANPNFKLVIRATLAQPDMYYVNQMAHDLHKADPATFNKLF